MRDGSVLQGDKAPRQKDLADWLMKNPHYAVDTQAFQIPGITFPNIIHQRRVDIVETQRRRRLCFGQLLGRGRWRHGPAPNRRGERDSHPPEVGEEDLGTQSAAAEIAGGVAGDQPGLRHRRGLGGYPPRAGRHVRCSPVDLLREGEARPEERRQQQQRRQSRRQSGGQPLRRGQPLRARLPAGRGLSAGAASRFPMPFPGLPGFPLSSALMGMLPGMPADGESAGSLKGNSSGKKGDAASTASSSSSSKTRERERDRERDTTAAVGSSSRKSKAEKDKAEKEQQQQAAALESMMQSQLPFIFPQAGLFPGLNPVFAQAAAAGFPMGPGPLLNDFDRPTAAEKTRATKEKRGRGTTASPRPVRRVRAHPPGTRTRQGGTVRRAPARPPPAESRAGGVPEGAGAPSAGEGRRRATKRRTRKVFPFSCWYGLEPGLWPFCSSP
ncbi:uncharacterized protein LOC129600795 [Paramacrobiotus metropolitanus]|uniref:uncharacterized protein LOC129600795 n=1 Tax=Paramacrobiotus metropolitanus TaxID=2943436 RepID=UPI0024460216|nr:uncharacterized protein LOC129600795 [Paramacrobiotus metropolitanus]XP_055355353.1 uncharacterized protein LOC129600795 [Paramacrobiotus metropolitanus]XP_055355354.1 uncharacterized protein LOC129600795 [Paramacrobiotus metropolitanus]